MSRTLQDFLAIPQNTGLQALYRKVGKPGKDAGRGVFLLHYRLKDGTRIQITHNGQTIQDMSFIQGDIHYHRVFAYGEPASFKRNEWLVFPDFTLGFSGIKDEPLRPTGKTDYLFVIEDPALEILIKQSGSGFETKARFTLGEQEYELDVQSLPTPSGPQGRLSVQPV